jgi:CRP/FNR family transcriptional regulator
MKKEEINIIPLFAGLSEEQLKIIISAAREVEYKKGDIIFQDGDEGKGFYVIISGKIKIFKLSGEGKEQILHIFGSGEPIAEVPIFEGRSFPANAQALEKSRLVFFSRKNFVDLIKNDPSLALNMLAVLSRRLRQLTLMVESLSLKDVHGRLAAYFLYLSEKAQGKDTFELDISKGLLASLIGTIPETLSRALNKMAAQQLIEVEGPIIKIINRKQLQDLAASETYLTLHE